MGDGRWLSGPRACPLICASIRGDVGMVHYMPFIRDL